jgi:hypothetical protein
VRDKPTNIVGEHESRRRRGSHARPSRPGDRAFLGRHISIPPGAIDPEQTYIDGATNFADAVLVLNQAMAALEMASAEVERQVAHLPIEAPASSLS